MTGTFSEAIIVTRCVLTIDHRLASYLPPPYHAHITSTVGLDAFLLSLLSLSLSLSLFVHCNRVLCQPCVHSLFSSQFIVLVLSNLLLPPACMIHAWFCTGIWSRKQDNFTVSTRASMRFYEFHRWKNIGFRIRLLCRPGTYILDISSPSGISSIVQGVGASNGRRK